MNYLLSRETLYFAGTAVFGGVLLAVGQPWAIGIVGGGGAGAVASGVNGFLKHRRALPLEMDDAGAYEPNRIQEE
jgi:protein-S-isoprenylcysteine O-methyltransferase Ste14